MMQMIYLIPEVEGRFTFDLKKLQAAIESLAGIKNYRIGRDSAEANGFLLGYDLEMNDTDIWPVPIEVRSNPSCVSIGAYHKRGLSAALEIQKQYGGEIYAFSEESSPIVVLLSTVGSPQELEQLLKLR